MGIGKWIITILIIMLGIFIVKFALKKFNVPVLSNLAEQV